jgi:hypothetical protein
MLQSNAAPGSKESPARERSMARIDVTQHGWLLKSIDKRRPAALGLVGAFPFSLQATKQQKVVQQSPV